MGMELFVTKAPYNVLAFDQKPDIVEEPVILAGETIRPGDCLTAIVGGSRTAAGFGSFELESGFIRYAGTYNHHDKRGNVPYVLFDYDWPVNPADHITGHKFFYVGWVLLSDGNLFYEIRRNGRVIIPTEIRRFDLSEMKKRTIKTFANELAQLTGEDPQTVFNRVRWWKRSGHLPVHKDPVTGVYITEADPQTFQPPAAKGRPRKDK